MRRRSLRQLLNTYLGGPEIVVDDRFKPRGSAFSWVITAGVLLAGSLAWVGHFTKELESVKTTFDSAYTWIEASIRPSVKILTVASQVKGLNIEVENRTNATIVIGNATIEFKPAKREAGSNKGDIIGQELPGFIAYMNVSDSPIVKPRTSRPLLFEIGQGPHSVGDVPLIITGGTCKIVLKWKEDSERNSHPLESTRDCGDFAEIFRTQATHR